jgi:hypothetical protein
MFGGKRTEKLNFIVLGCMAIEKFNKVKESFLCLELAA